MPEREPRKIQRRGRQEATAIVLEVVHLLATWGIERRELGCSGVTQRSELEMLGIHLCKIKQRRYVLILLFSSTSLSTEVTFPQ